MGWVLGLAMSCASFCASWCMEHLCCCSSPALGIGPGSEGPPFQGSQLLPHPRVSIWVLPEVTQHRLPARRPGFLCLFLL